MHVDSRVTRNIFTNKYHAIYTQCLNSLIMKAYLLSLELDFWKAVLRKYCYVGIFLQSLSAMIARG